MKNKILELFEKHTGYCDVQGDSFKVIHDDEFEDIAEEIVKLFAIPVVVGQGEQLCLCETDKKALTASVYCPTHNKIINPE